MTAQSVFANIELNGNPMSEASKAGTSIAKRVQDPLSTADELAALVGISAKVNRLIASHSRAGADTLQKLSSRRDEITRENVATNPNAPLDVLIDLANEFPRAVRLNPAFVLIILENPGVLERLRGTWIIASVLQQKECPLSIIKWAFARYSKERFDSTVLMGIVRNPTVPINILDAILRLDTRTEITGAEGFL